MKPLRFRNPALKSASVLFAFFAACSSSEKAAETTALGETSKLEEIAGGDALNGSPSTDTPPAALGAMAATSGDPTLDVPASPVPSTTVDPAQAVPAADGATPTAAQAAGALDHKRAVSSDLPSISQAPFQQEGFWMNAYYFVRSPNETWDSLSQLFYGRPDRADLLKNWNKKAKLHVGQVVYYNSPSRPDDSTGLRIFAEDFGAPLEQVIVKAGDSMSLIGQRRFGHVKTWKEIAILNPEVPNPDVIAAGQVLKVQPAQIDTAAVLERIVKEVTAGQQARAAESSPTPAAHDEAAAAAATATVESKPSDLPPPPSAEVPTDHVAPPAPDSVQSAAAPAPEAEPTPIDASASSSFASSLKSSNMLAMVGGGLLLVALVLIVSKRLAKVRAAKTRVQ
jgi:hypothetical protein